MSTKILIVDDEPNLLRMLEFALQAEGYATILARKGQEALQKIKLERPDLVILDVMLPDITGLEICQHLRGRAETAALPIIMLSARGQVPDKVAGLQAGADEYLTKPVDSTELAARVAALLLRTRRLAQARSGSQGKVIGFMGVKGGTGTTTVALNVAAVLAAQGKAVNALELRSYPGTFSTQLGGFSADLTGLLELHPTVITEQILMTHLLNHPSGLQLLFGPQRLETDRHIEPAHVEAIVRAANCMADYTLLDLPAQPTAANRAALQLCNLVVMVIEPDPGCVGAAKSTLDLLSSWRVHSSAVRVVVTNRNGLSMKVEGLRAQLGCEIIGVVPPAVEACWAAQVHHTPLVQYQPESLAAVQLSEIAGRLSTKQTKPLRRLN